MFAHMLESGKSNNRKRGCTGGALAWIPAPAQEDKLLTVICRFGFGRRGEMLRCLCKNSHPHLVWYCPSGAFADQTGDVSGGHFVMVATMPSGTSETRILIIDSIRNFANKLRDNIVRRLAQCLVADFRPGAQGSFLGLERKEDAVSNAPLHYSSSVNGPSSPK